MIRVFLADDHEIVRHGLRSIIVKVRPEWEICGEASDGQKAVECVKALNPDLVILDLTMPVVSGLEAAARISKLGLACRILVFTMHESERLRGDIEQAGAHGYVQKSRAGRELISAMDTLLAGGTFFGPLNSAD